MKRILILHPEGNSFNNPTLKAFIDHCVAEDVEVDIWHRRSLAPTPQTPKVKWLSYGRIWALMKMWALSRICSKAIASVLVHLENWFVFRTYDLIIGVDREGLIDAHHLSRLTKVPYVFFSFEIMFANETSEKFKRYEREAAASVRLWLVQDSDRALHLSRENGLDMKNVFLCPVSSPGSPSLPLRRLRDALSIPPEKKVAIVIGSIASWSMADRILASVISWPDDWVLLVHERYGRTLELVERFGGNTSRLLGSKIFVNNEPVDAVDDMGAVLSGADVGLAFYQPDYKSPFTGRNLEVLGLASGKVATYLRHGIPVLMNSIGRYAVDAKRRGFGVVVDSAHDIPAALANTDWRGPSVRAREYFDKEIDADLFVPHLFNRLKLTSHCVVQESS